MEMTGISGKKGNDITVFQFMPPLEPYLHPRIGDNVETER